MAEVFYADAWGVRDGKYRDLVQSDVSGTDWHALEPAHPHFFFVPKDLDLHAEYQSGWSPSRAFPLHQRGAATRRDHFMVAFERAEMRRRLLALSGDLSDEEISQQFGVGSTKYWSLSEAREIVRRRANIADDILKYEYRPFDTRYVAYIPDIIERGDAAVRLMQHLVHPNKALLCFRRIRGELSHVAFACDKLVDKTILSARDNVTVFPLYIYGAPTERTPPLFTAGAGLDRAANLAPGLITAVAEKLVLDFVHDGKGDLQNTFGPEDIFHYMYAVFHSPTYRERYAEFLKIDFPRLPLTSDLELFRALAAKGEQLVALHLMESPRLNDLITTFPVSDRNDVEKVHYSEPAEDRPGRVYINKTQYFEGVEPEVWEFHIGGYQVLHKWLKDRKGRRLSFDDLLHYQKIVVALKETMRLMEQIDEVIPSWPIE